MNFRPSEKVGTIFDIDYARLRTLGKRALLFDLDKALVGRGARTLPASVAGLLRGLAASGFAVGILTNRHPKRAMSKVEYPIRYHARKPRREGYLEVLESLACSPEEAVVIGDRLLTDVWGGNRLGIYTIHVRRAPTTLPGKE